MELVKQISTSFYDIKKNKLLYTYIFFQLMVFNSIHIYFNTDYILIISLFFSLIVFIKEKANFTKETYLAFAVFFLLYLIIALFNGYFNYYLFLGSFTRFSIAIIIINALSVRFLEKLENLVFLLTVISIPLYIVSVISPDIFDYFEPITYLAGKRDAYARNLIIYNYNFWGVDRNSGFMGEPARFAGIIAWALIVSFYKYGTKFNSRNIIYFIALLTTISIGAYIYLILFLLLILIQKNVLHGIFYMLVILITVWGLSKVPFVQDRYEYIKWKISAYEESQEEGAENVDERRVSRNAGLILDMKYIAQSPLGFGEYRDNTNFKNMAKSPNGFSRYVIRWGIIGLFFLIIGVKKTIKQLKFYYKTWVKYPIILLLIFLATLNGNPIDRSIMIYLFILLGLIKPISIQLHATRNITI